MPTQQISMLVGSTLHALAAARSVAGSRPAHRLARPVEAAVDEQPAVQHSKLVVHVELVRVHLHGHACAALHARAHACLWAHVRTRTSCHARVLVPRRLRLRAAHLLPSGW